MSTEERIKKEENVSRREFLKYSAAGIVAAGGGSLLAGCGPQPGATEEAAADAAGAAAEAAAPAEASAAAACAHPLGYMCDADWLGEPPVVADADIAETITADVVILGGGHAGTQAALAAAQLGATVAVIEKQSEADYTFKGDDICSYNSQFMLDRGFGPYDTGEIVAEFVKRGGGRVSAEIIHLFVANSGEMMDNMVSLVPETSNLLDLEDEQCIIQVAYGKSSGSDYPVEQGGYKSWATTLQTIGTTNPTAVNGREGLSRLTEIETYVMLEAIRLGATWYHEYDATILVQNADGDVTGAIAKGPDGTYTKFEANKGVLLATGDFAANPDMCWQLLTETPEWAGRVGQGKETVIGMSACDGIGHKMGCWAGGFIEQHPRPTMKNGGGPGGPWGTAPFLWLNAFGNRYMNEAQVPAAYNETLRQPVGPTATVTDSKWMQTVQMASIDHGAPNWGYPKAFETLQADMDAVLGTGAEGKEIGGVAIINLANPGMMKSTVYGAETLEELAGYLGYTDESLDNFLATVEAYNELCNAGKDTQFGKDAQLMIPVDEAPFYGVVTQNTGEVNAGLVTLTGLVTDANLQVLKADRKTPIKGLYATGNCLGQRFGPQYSTPSAGASMGMAMTHGRVAGKIIASL